MHVPLTTIAQGDGSRITEPRQMIARSENEWHGLWALHAGPDAAAPPVDFPYAIVAAVFAGEKPSAGHRIEIARAEQDPAGRVSLFVEEQKPSVEMVSATILTSPFHIVSMPRVDGEIVWEPIAEGRSPMAEGSSPIGHRSSVIGSSTGLDPRTASALAYLAGPFSGALILFAETVNRDVRFHAWQSIVALGGLGLAVLASYVLAFLSLFVSAAAVSLMFGVATVIWIVLVVVWLICLWKAFSGERWKVPLAGDYAERLATPRTS
jgi:uncharacterized membrane protein